MYQYQAAQDVSALAERNRTLAALVASTLERIVYDHVLTEWMAREESDNLPLPVSDKCTLSAW